MKNSRKKSLRLAFLILTLCSLATISFVVISENSLSILILFPFFWLAGGLWAEFFDGKRGLLVFSSVYVYTSCIAALLYFYYESRYGVPYFNGGSDDLRYELDGILTAQSHGIFDFEISSNFHDVRFHNSPAYVYLVSLLYRVGEVLGGYHSLIPRLFNCLLVGVSALLVSRLVRKNGGSEKAALRAALFFGFMPVIAIVSGNIFRDTIILFLTLAVVNLMTFAPVYGNAKKPSSVLVVSVSCLLILLMVPFRNEAALLLGAYLVFCLMFSKRLISSKMAPFLVILYCFLALGLSFYFTDDLSGYTSLVGDRIDHYSQARSRGEGLYSAIYSQPLLPFGGFLRILFGLVSPIPLPVLELDRVYLSIGGAIQLLFMPVVLLGILQVVKNRSMLPLIVLTILLFVSSAVFSGTFRHIVSYYGLATVIGAVAYETITNKRRYLFVTLGFFSALPPIYVVLKYF